ncbi:MAG: methenyltetrahydromethanopterin cyclohydrolase [Lachnospiraceae bacterium]|nr:methenyltetrahydromethanopterin cyclohydrolase [Lachnospiraceae bacterium]
MFSVNQYAVQIVKEKILPYVEKLNCKVYHLQNGATVIDMGVKAPGGYQAGKLFVEATIAGMGYVEYGRFHLGKIDLPSIDVYIDQPPTACLSTQFSGWKMRTKDIPLYINPIGSGPARAIANNDVFTQAWTYQDVHHETVFGAQTQELPNEQDAQDIADACHIDPSNVYILAARTGSLVGSIQVCSRTVEASISRIQKKGFDISKVISGFGTCPIAPPIYDEVRAMDRVNTALLYGCDVKYLVDCEDSEIEACIDKLPFNASRRFGERFYDLFEEGKHDFYIVDKDIHTVARYEITNLKTGNTFRAGELREDMLEESLFH